MAEIKRWLKNKLHWARPNITDPAQVYDRPEEFTKRVRNSSNVQRTVLPFDPNDELWKLLGTVINDTTSQPVHALIILPLDWETKAEIHTALHELNSAGQQREAETIIRIMREDHFRDTMEEIGKFTEEAFDGQWRTLWSHDKAYQLKD
ncbi:hypothetical protein HY357_02740 [Candidatus Roizmanbacteria bacterium]|nr:hypothetical protein [Candidatus Roizmanbacteria bacterium]